MSVITSIRGAAAQSLRNTSPPTTDAGGSGEFARVLKAQLDERQITISAHAADRMVRRGLIPDETTIRQLQTAFDLAAEKGSREALFLLDGMAVVASVPDRTVKTALDRQSLAAGVFTQIDAAVVVNSRAPEDNNNNNPTINRSLRSSGWAPTGEATIQPGGLPL
jgi:flagellar operon protein